MCSSISKTARSALENLPEPKIYLVCNFSFLKNISFIPERLYIFISEVNISSDFTTTKKQPKDECHVTCSFES